MLALFLCFANDSEELCWWMIYNKKKHSFFFFFELGSLRALRAASYCSTPTCSTAGKQPSEGFNGILPEAVLLRCRLFPLPLQLTPFTVSCPLPFHPRCHPPNNAPNYSLHLVLVVQCGQIGERALLGQMN